MKTNKNSLIDKGLLMLTILYLLYTFWFQYAFFSVNNFLTIIGLAMLVCILFKLLFENNFRLSFRVAYYLLALIAILSVSTFFSPQIRLSFSSIIEIAKYCIPLIAIVSISSTKGNVYKILFWVFVSSLLISIWSFFKEIYLFSYEVDASLKTGEGTMNSNVFSSLLLIGEFCALILLTQQKRKINWMIIASIIIEFIAQIKASSRRGIIVFAFLALAFLIYDLIINKKNKHFKISLFIVFGLLAVFIFISNLEVIESKFTGIYRLFGGYTGGDSERALYQAYAFDLFLTNPIFGRGLNSVALGIGMYSHSLYFELLASTGIIGVTFVIGYFVRNIIISRKFLRYYKASSYENRMPIFLYLFFNLSILISGISVVMIYDFYFYIIIGILISLHNELNLNPIRIRVDQRENIIIKPIQYSKE